LAVLGIAYANALTTYLRQQREIAELEAKVAAETASITQLEDALARWEDPDYVRAQARARLGWVLPGETGYRVISADGELLSGPAEEAARAAAEVDLGPWYEQVWSSVKAADADEAVGGEPEEEDPAEAAGSETAEPSDSPEPPR
jgi:hypothetical protein